jgi:hypothetical protein
MFSRQTPPQYMAAALATENMEAVYRAVADGSLVAAVNGAMHEVANPS